MSREPVSDGPYRSVYVRLEYDTAGNPIFLTGGGEQARFARRWFDAWDRARAAERVGGRAARAVGWAVGKLTR